MFLNELVYAQKVLICELHFISFSKGIEYRTHCSEKNIKPAINVSANGPYVAVL